MAGSLASDVLVERDLERYVVGEMSKFEEAFVARIEASKASGELPRRFPSKATAQMLVTYLQGLFRVIRVLNTRREVEGEVGALLARPRSLSSSLIGVRQPGAGCSWIG